MRGTRALDWAPGPSIPGRGACGRRRRRNRRPREPLRVPPPHRPSQLANRVFRGSDAVAAGLLTKDGLRSSAWRRLYRGVYADAALEPGFPLRVAGAALLLPAAAAFSGRTAAHLLGARTLVDPGTPVEVTVPPHVRFGPVAGLRVRRMPMPDDDVLLLGGRRVTTGCGPPSTSPAARPWRTPSPRWTCSSVGPSSASANCGRRSPTSGASTVAAGPSVRSRWPALSPSRSRRAGCACSWSSRACRRCRSSPCGTGKALSWPASIWASRIGR